jgi:thioredoxin-like negative regulator of GroEL
MIAVDEFTLYPELARAGGPVLVVVTGAHCGACRHLRLVLGEVARRMPALTLFEVDAGVSGALVAEWEVFHLPSMLLFLDGIFHARVEAPARSGAIVGAVEALLARPAQEAP